MNKNHSGGMLVMLGILVWFISQNPLMAKVQNQRIFPNYTGTKAKQLTREAKLYTYPDIDSKLIKQVSCEDPIYILGSNQSWYRVRTQGVEGWIEKDQITTSKDSFIPYSRVRGEEVVAYAKQFIGTPYVWGGNDLKRGVDCSGLTQKVFEGFDIRISRLSYMQAGDGKRVAKSQLKPGDLVFFDTTGAHNGQISHVGIYAGEGMFLHADCTHGVTLSSLNSNYYTRNYVAGTRILNQG